MLSANYWIQINSEIYHDVADMASWRIIKDALWVNPETLSPHLPRPGARGLGPHCEHQGSGDSDLEIDIEIKGKDVRNESFS